MDAQTEALNYTSGVYIRQLTQYKHLGREKTRQMVLF